MKQLFFILASIVILSFTSCNNQARVERKQNEFFQLLEATSDCTVIENQRMKLKFSHEEFRKKGYPMKYYRKIKRHAKEANKLFEEAEKSPLPDGAAVTIPL